LFQSTKNQKHKNKNTRTKKKKKNPNNSNCALSSEFLTQNSVTFLRSCLFLFHLFFSINKLMLHMHGCGAAGLTLDPGHRGEPPLIGAPATAAGPGAVAPSPPVRPRVGSGWRRTQVGAALSSRHAEIPAAAAAAQGQGLGPGNVCVFSFFFPFLFLNNCFFLSTFGTMIN
jgi:hypothetical protein